MRSFSDHRSGRSVVFLWIEECIRLGFGRAFRKSKFGSFGERIKREAGTIVLDQTEQQKGNVVVEPVRTKDVPVALTVPGRLTFSEDRTWRVGAIATGRVEDLQVVLGDSVRADQLLGHIHSHEVHEARAGYEQAKIEVDRAQSAEAYAKERRDRAQRLFDLRAGSRQDLETAEVELKNAEAAIQKAQSELEKERAHLAIFRIPLDPPAAERYRPGRSRRR